MGGMMEEDDFFNIIPLNFEILSKATENICQFGLEQPLIIEEMDEESTKIIEELIVK